MGLRIIGAGECHTKRIFKSEIFLNALKPTFEFVDMSYGDGKIERTSEMLEVFQFRENDIFLLGGTPQEALISEVSYKARLTRFIDSIFLRYKNAKIIFWNSAVREDHKSFADRVQIGQIKAAAANGRNVFAYTMHHTDSDFINASHYTETGNNKLICGISDFISAHRSILLEQRYENVAPEQTMSFRPNEAVIFLLEYKEHIPAKIDVTYHGTDKTSQFNHHSSVNVIPDRKNIFKLKNVKTISFEPNIVPLHCQIQHY
jgi:hypothetical protein